MGSKAVWILAVALAALMGCEPSSGTSGPPLAASAATVSNEEDGDNVSALKAKIEELESEKAELEDKVERLSEAAKTVATAAQSARDEAGRFGDGENWRDVVPDLEAAADEAATAAEEAESIADE